MSVDQSFSDFEKIEMHDEIRKIEDLIGAMQESETGINFKSQKVFLTTIPAAVSGDDMIAWIDTFLSVEDTQEAAHLASILLMYGYIYPLTDYKSAIVKDDPTSFYRFQAPYYWLSKISKPDAMDYAIYLVKRTLRARQKYGLEDYEQSALHRLQNLMAHKWEFVCSQAADQVRLYKEKRKSDKIVLEAQERAFWRVHQPPPGKTSLFEERLPRNRYFNRRIHSWRDVQNALLQKKEKTCRHDSDASLTNNSQGHLKISRKKSVENLLMFASNRSSYDWFLTGRSSDLITPWLMQPSDTDPFPWTSLVGLPTCDAILSEQPLGSTLTQSKSTSENLVTNETSFGNMVLSIPTVNQVRLWATSVDNLLWDPVGCQAFKLFLEKEFSSENLRFWLAVNAFQFGPILTLNENCEKIYEEFLGSNAVSEINIDSKTMSITKEAIKKPSRFTFEDAKQHIYKLMKNDSYTRFIRSDDFSALLRLALSYQYRRMTGKNSLSFGTGQTDESSTASVVNSSSMGTFVRQATRLSSAS